LDIISSAILRFFERECKSQRYAMARGTTGRFATTVQLVPMPRAPVSSAHVSLPLKLPDGQPPDPAMLVTAVPNWSVGDVITVGRENHCASSRSTTSRMRTLVEQDVRAIFTVEPV
jgi:hypothetical protein